LAALMDGRVEDARGIFQIAFGVLPDGDKNAEWLEDLLRAASDPREVPKAIRSITRAASEGTIDTVTEILCGVALKQPDFVFNRLLRLHARREPLPLQMLWLQQTAFLREHPRFKGLIEKLGLRQYWDEDGLPDYCGWEPAAVGCQSAAATTAATR